MGLWRGNQPWWQQGSFVEPVTPPDADPADAPQVCVSFNRSWLPYIVGSLLQLAQPSSWATGDPSAVLTAATELIERFGTAEECVGLEFRLTDGCVLQSSTDGGSTWEDVSGWPTNAPGCFTGETGATGATGPQGEQGDPGPASIWRMNGCDLQYSNDGGTTWTTASGWSGFPQECITPGPPTNPLGSSTSDLACSIAAYMATEVINGGIQHVVDEINATKTMVQTVQSLLGLVFFVDVPIAIALELGATAFSIIQALNLTDLQTGLDDTTYFHNVECAIYLAIVADGAITPSNWASVVTAIEAVTAPNAATASAISGYLSGMDAAAAMYMQQQGPIYVGDCSDCTAPAGCVVLTAATIGSHAAYNTVGAGAGHFSMTAGGSYAGVVGDTMTIGVAKTLRCKMTAGRGEIGFFHGSLANGGPSAGNNLWVNSIDVAFVWSAGTWYILDQGNVHSTGTYGSQGDLLQIHWDGGGGFSMYINATAVGSITGYAGTQAYKTIVVGINSGDLMDDVLICN